MAVQPIDLAAVYVQMDNVAKTQSRAAQAALSDAMQQQKLAAQDAEKASQVQQAAKHEAKALTVSDQGGGNSGGYSGQRQKRGQNSEQEGGVPHEVLKESWLGQHVDITG